MVFAGVSSNYAPAGNPFHFPNIKTKRGDQWNDSTSVYTIQEARALYFVCLSVGAIGGAPADFTMVLSGQKYAGITSTSRNNNNVNTVSRDVMVPLYAADTIHVSSENQVWGATLETSVAIFSLSYSMRNERDAFAVAREDTFSGSANPVQFTSSIYNAGNFYNEFTHTAIAPSGGIYYFSFSVGLIAGGKANFTLYKNGQAFVNILHESTIHTGTDIRGRSVMMELEENDIVHIGNPAGYTVRSSSLKETSFSGFKYQPKHGNLVFVQSFALFNNYWPNIYPKSMICLM